MSIYPSDTYWERYDSSRTIVFTVIIACVFLLTATVFLIYVHYVQRHQNKVTAAAVRTSAIVSSLFPENIRDRILKDAEDQAQRELDKNEPRNLLSHRRQSKSLSDFFDGEPESQTNGLDTKPIADLFPETTIMFADLVGACQGFCCECLFVAKLVFSNTPPSASPTGFTAWSSVREPCQVFTLLETVYHAFDEIANRRNVFKVETIGDCYVAVCGLPQARKDHAVVMARFAKDCLKKLHGLTTKLEAKLGPDTGELDIRIGLHSGPVTAGVLRGEKSRFQVRPGTRVVESIVELMSKHLSIMKARAPCVLSGLTTFYPSSLVTLSTLQLEWNRMESGVAFTYHRKLRGCLLMLEKDTGFPKEKRKSMQRVRVNCKLTG
jgi:class 3 adenylate cyclase